MTLFYLAKKSGKTISRRRFIESGSIAGVGVLIMSGCGRKPSDDRLTIWDQDYPPERDKDGYLHNGFFSTSSTPAQALPVTVQLRSFAILGSGAYRIGYWRTKVRFSATLRDTVTIRSYDNGWPRQIGNDFAITQETILLTEGASTEIAFTGLKTFMEVLTGNPSTQIMIIYEYWGSVHVVNLLAIARLATTPVQMASKSVSTVIDDKIRSTGVSIINPNAESVTITYALRKADGSSLITAQRSIQAGAQRGDYFFIMDEFAAALQESFNGTMTIEASRPVVVFSLSHEANVVHVKEHPTGNSLETELIYPYAPVRSTDSTVIDLIAGDQDATYSIDFRNQDGTPRTITTESHGTASTFSVTVPANNLQRLMPSQYDSQGALQNSSGCMIITKPATARADIYNLHGSQERYMPASNDAPEQRIILDGDVRIALYNPNAEPCVTAVRLVNQNGITTFDASLNLNAGQQLEGALSGLLNRSLIGFTGTVHFRNTNAGHEEKSIAISAFSSTDAGDQDRMTLPVAMGGYYPDLVRLIITPNDMSLLKRIDQLPVLDGIPEVTGDAVLYVNGKARPLAATGANVWAPVGTTITLDMEHPQYCNDITIAKTNLQTGSTIGYKDSTQTLEITISDEMKGQTIPLYLLQRRNP
jgi:hypothetical protein